ncbi:MAG: hypothetical protein ACXWLH_00500 [Candidatus Saccharimonadales bacterium]
MEVTSERKIPSPRLRKLCLAPVIGKLVRFATNNKTIKVECPQHGQFDLWAKEIVLTKNIASNAPDSYIFTCSGSKSGYEEPADHRISKPASYRIAQILVESGVRVRMVDTSPQADHPLQSGVNEMLTSLSPDDESKLADMDLDTLNQAIQTEVFGNRF